jgi:DNA ligase-1
MDTMGVLHVRDIHNGLEFGLGTGFNDDDRKWFWENRDKVSGLIIKYRYFPVGMKDLPRHPSYKGIRDKDDLS